VKKCTHHDHITGKYIGALCSSCNIELQYQRFLPIYVHNLKGCDSHFIVLALSKYGYQEYDISCIPNHEGKYISFSKNIEVDKFLNEKKNEVIVKYEI
jgi:hypothetical protein